MCAYVHMQSVNVIIPQASHLLKISFKLSTENYIHESKIYALVQRIQHHNHALLMNVFW